MINHDLADLVKAAIKKAQKKGDLPDFEVPEVVIGHPKQAEHGDFATPVCMSMARLARMAPVKIADIVRGYLPQREYIAGTATAHPGFINFTLDDAWVARQVDGILSTPTTFGDVDLGKGRKMQVEFVSANPTGPLTVGSGRNAVIGDALARVLAAAGYAVQREYYVNDGGTQMRHFADTLYARYAQALGRDEPVSEQGYQGAYMIDLGRDIAAREGDRFLHMERAEATEALSDLGLAAMLKSISTDLAFMGIEYDHWFSEKSIYTSGLFGKVMTLLRERNLIAEHDGAVWFAATDVGDDKDAVIIRSDGTPGYFASDIAYHYNKFVERGFDWVIDVWGADHQGHVPRMKSAMKALGVDPKRLTVLLYQLVTLKRGGEIVRLSKRTGDIITLREVLEEVGSDAVRFFLLSRSADSQMDFDLTLAKEESDVNPVWYVQYGHARVCSILRKAEGLGMEFADGDVALLTAPAEQALIRQMLLLPEIVEMAAEDLAPHHLTHYAQDLASLFHSFYKQCRVISSEPGDEALTKARLKLTLAAKHVLARTLNLMGMTAPESMWREGTSRRSDGKARGYEETSEVCETSEVWGLMNEQVELRYYVDLFTYGK